jgi:hypothetical protein
LHTFGDAMNIHKKILILSCLSFTALNAAIVDKKALTIVPIADLTGQSLQSLGNQNTQKAYASLPICGKSGTYACPRIHQLLFNEVVTILEEQKDEVKVQINNVFYQTHTNNMPQDVYWTLKKNLITFDQLKKQGINMTLIPDPISYKEKKTKSTQPTITLAFPFADRATGRFSAGTRFVCTSAQLDNKTIKAYSYDPKIKRIRMIDIPRNICIDATEKSKDEKAKLFAQVIRKWSTHNNGFIPYVWGGCSFASLCAKDEFAQIDSKDNRGNNITFYKRPDSPMSPHSGFDCAGLIARAAQLCGIPYFLKNTTTIAKHLDPLTKNNAVNDGDIIWFPSHVMVVGDTKKNTLLEARHYGHGYGKVHELPLSKVFKNIETYDQLKQAFLENKPLQRLHKDGTVAQTIPSFKLLKLASVWNL